MAASAKVKKVHLLSALTFGHFAWAKLDDPQYVQERDQVLLAIAWSLQTLVITSLLSGIAVVVEVLADFTLKIPDASFWSSGWLIGAITASGNTYKLGPDQFSPWLKSRINARFSYLLLSRAFAPIIE